MSTMGAVDVWLADLAQVPEGLNSHLSSDERERASQLRDERARRLWVASRAVLRDLLGRRLGVDPVALSFEAGPNGKPRLSGRWTGAVRFNLSHSGTLALYALCADREVGVDVETAARRSSGAGKEVAIARRMLGEAVASRLEQFGPAERSRQFLQAWAVHEAGVKCLGVGLGAAAGDKATEEPAVWVRPLAVGGGAFAALAVQGGPVAVRRRVWRARESEREGAMSAVDRRLHPH